MKKTIASFATFIVLTILLSGHVSFSQETAPNEKAAKYLTALEKRPVSEILFSRFFEAWLETGTIAECAEFLETEAAKSPAKKILLARFHLRQGDSEVAASVLQEIAGKKDTAPVIRVFAWMELAGVSSLEQDYDLALTQVESAVKILTQIEKPNTKTETVLGQLHGRLLIKTGAREDGLKIWKALLAKRPDDSILHEDVVELLANEGLFDEAIKEQNVLISKAEKAKDVYAAVLRKIDLGKLFTKASRRKEAISIWKKTLPSAGHDTWVERELIGLVKEDFRRSNNLTGWRQALEEMISSEPKRIALKIDLAKVLTDLREDSKALEIWRKILALTPGNQKLRLEYVQNLAALDRPEEAAEQLLHLTKQEPDDPELWFYLAELQHDAKQAEAAGKSLVTFLNKSDGSEFSHIRAARQLQRYDLIPQSESVFQKTIAKFPESISANDSFARFLYATDRKEKALARWKKIGESGDLNQMLSVVRQLGYYFESEAAYSLLHGRFEEFRNEAPFLDEICQIALAADKATQAYPWSLRRLEIATGSDDLQRSINQAIQLAARVDDLENIAAQLGGEKELSIAGKCLLATIRQRIGEQKAAVEILDSLIPEAKDRSEFVLTTLANIHRRNENWKEAIATMETLLASSGGRKPPYIRTIIDLYEKAAQPEAALKWAREWKKLASGSPSPWMREAEMLNKSGRISESLKVLQAATRRFENDAQLRIKLARTYTEAGYPIEAENVLWKLYESTEDDWKRRVWIKDMVKLAQETKRTDKLISRFKKRHQTNSQSISPLLALAEVYRLTNKSREFRTSLSQASRLDADNIQLVHQIASLDQSEGRIDSAISELERILKKDKTARSSAMLARLQMSIGKVAEALATLEQLPSGRKASPDQLIELARSAMIMGEWKTAATFLSSKILAHPDNVQLHYLRAIALLESDQIEESKEAFLKLLTMDVPKGSIPSTPNQQGRYAAFQIRQQQGIQSAPLTTPLLKIKQRALAYSRARAYRRQFGEGTLFSLFSLNSSSRQVSPFPTPTDTLTLQSTAVAQLHFLKKQIKNEKERSDLDQKIGSLGFSDFELAYFKFASESPRDRRLLGNGNYISRSREFFLKHSNSPEAALLWFEGLGTTGLHDDEMVNAILPTIQSNSGEEAKIIALLKLSSFGDNDNISAQLIDSISRFDSPSSALVSTAARFFVSFHSSSAVKISSKSKNAIFSLLKKWKALPKKEQPPGLIAAVAMAYVVQGDTKGWVELLKNERRQSQEPDTTPDRSPNALYQNYNQFSGLNNSLPTISPPILKMLRSGSRAIPDKPEIWIKEFSDDPILFGLLANTSGEAGLISSAKEKLVRISEKDGTETFAAALMLLATQEFIGKNIEAALPYLKSARKLTLSPDFTKTVDMKLVLMARESTPKTDLREAGVAAALRLRSSRAVDSQYEWPQIAQLLQKWKLPRKAQRPTSLIANRTINTPRYQRQSYPPRVSVSSLPNFQTFSSQVNRLIADKNDDAIVRFMAHQFPIFAGALLNGQGEQNKRQFQNIRDNIEKTKLVDSIIKMARPGKESTQLEQARFSAMCDALGKSDVAIQEYTKLIKSETRNLILRLRRFHLLAGSDPEKASEELKILVRNKTAIPFLGPALSSIASLQSKDMESRLKVAEWLVSVFDQFSKIDVNPNKVAAADPFGMPPSRWPTDLAQSLGRSFREGKLNYPAIGGQERDFSGSVKTSEQKKESDSEEFTQLNKRRIALLLSLLKKQIDSPGRSDGAFSSLVKLAHQIDIPDSEILPYCQKTVREVSNSYIYPLTSNIYTPTKILSQGEFVWKNSGNPAPPHSAPSPLPWLIEYAFRTKQQGLVTDPTLFSGISDNADRQLFKKQIECISNLYFCKPAKFDQTFTIPQQVNPKVVMFSGRQVYRNPRTDNAFFLRALALRPEVENNFDWESFIVSRFASPGNSGDHRTLAQAYARNLVIKKGDAALDRFFERVAEGFLGKREHRLLLVAEFKNRVDQKNRSSDGKWKKLTGLATFLGSMTQFPETAFHTLKKAQEFGMENWDPFSQQATNITNPRGLCLREVAEAMISCSFLNRDLANYETFPRSEFPKLLEKKKEINSIVGGILSGIRDQLRSSSRENDRKYLRSKLENPKTFGQKLLLSMFSEIPHSEALAVFDEYIVRIQKLPEKQRKEIASLATDLIDLGKLTKIPSQDERNSILWLRSESGTARSRRIDEIIASKSFSKSEMERSNVRKNFITPIKGEITYDWRKAYAAFENISIILEKSDLDKGSGSMSKAFLEAIIPNAPFLEAYSFTSKVYSSQKLSPLFIYTRVDKKIKDLLRKETGNEEKVKMISDRLLRIKGQIKSDYSPAFNIPVLYDLVTSQSTSLLDDLLKWTEDNALLPEFAKDMEIAILIRQGKGLELKPEQRQRLRDAMKNTDSQLNLRLMFSKWVCQRFQYGSLDDRTLSIAASNLAESWEQYGSAVPEDFAAFILRAYVQGHSFSQKIESEKLSKRIAKALRSSYLGQGDSQEFTRESKGNPEFLDEAISIQLRVGDLAGASQLLKTFDSRLQNRDELFPILVRQGGHELAALMLRKHWRKLLSKKSSQYFDKKLGENIPPFLEGLSSDPKWRQWIAKCALYRLHDPRSSSRNKTVQKAGNWPDHKARLQEIGKEISTIDFPDEESLRLAVYSLLDFPDAATEMDGPLEKLMQSQTVVKIAFIKNSSLRAKEEKLFYKSLEIDLRKGKHERWTEIFAEVDGLTDEKINLGILKKLVSSAKSVALFDERSPDSTLDLIPIWTELVKRYPNDKTHYELGEILTYSISKAQKSASTEKLRTFFEVTPDSTLNIFAEILRQANSSLTPTFGLDPQFMRNDFFRWARNQEQMMHHISPFGWNPYEESEKSDPPINAFSILVREIHSRFLAVESFEEIAEDREGFVKKIGIMLVDAPSIPEKRILFDHACKLAKKETSSANHEWIEHEDNGWVYPSVFFKEYTKVESPTDNQKIVTYEELRTPDSLRIRSMPAANWDSIGFLVDLLWNETPANFSFTWSNVYRIDEIFARSLFLTKNKESTTLKITAILKDIRESLPKEDSQWGNSSVFIPIFYEFCRAIRSSDEVVKFVKVADQLAEKDVLAREFAIAGRLWIASFPNTPDAAKSLRNPNAWIDRAEELLSDKSLSLNIRACLARHFLYRAQKNCPEKLKRQIIQTVTELVLDDAPFNGWELGLFTNTILELPRQNDWWEPLAKNFAKAWNHKARFDGVDQMKEIPFTANVEAVLTVIELQFQLGDTEEINRMVKLYEPLLKKESRAIALMIVHDRHELALQWMNDSIEILTPIIHSVTGGAFQIYYDRKLDKSLGEFLPKVKREHHRLLIGSIIANAPLRPARWTTPQKQLRSKRITNLAKQFRDVSISHEVTWKRIRQYLCFNQEAAEVLSKSLARNFQTSDIRKILSMSGKSTVIGPEIRPLASFATAKALQGDVEPLRELMSRLGSADEYGTSWRYRFCVERCAWTLFEAISLELRNMSPKQIKWATEATQVYFDNLKGDVSFNKLVYLSRTHVILNALQSSNPKSTVWKTKFGEKERGRFLKILRKENNSSFSIPDSILPSSHPKFDLAKRALEYQIWHPPKKD